MTFSAFNLLSKVPHTLDATVKEVLGVCASSLENSADVQNGLFGWEAFKRSIDTYPGDKLVFDSYGNSSKDSQTMSVADAAKTSASFFFNSFHPNIEHQAIDEHITGALVNLERGKQEGWASFVPGQSAADSNPATDSSPSRIASLISTVKRLGRSDPLVKPDPPSFWELRFLLCSTSKSQPDELSAVACTVKIGAAIKDEADWFNFERETVEDFSLDLTGMNVLVTNGFKREARRQVTSST